MKFEIKVIILSVLFSFVCMMSFTYACSFVQKTIYTYQVGIYKESENKDAKLKELKQLGIDGYCYKKDQQYYVLSLICEDEKVLQQHASQVKGIVKTYVVSYDTTIADLLKTLASPNMIKSLPLEENPREKALQYGIETLSNVELLALVLRTGNKNESVLELAQRLLKEIGGIAQLTHVSYATLIGIKGIKQAKAIEILSIVEIAKRLKNEEHHNDQLLSPESIYLRMRDKMMFLKQEHFIVLCLSQSHRVIKEKTIFIGSLNMSVVTPREVFKEAIDVSSAKIVLLHNHPSGDALPSPEDLMLTEQFEKLGEMMLIEVVDHIIIGWNQYYSIKAEKLYYYILE